MSWTESQSVVGEPQERVNLVVERKEEHGKGCVEQKPWRERVIDSERPAGRIPALLSRCTLPWFPTDFIWTTPSHFLEWKLGVWHLLRLLSLATPTTCGFFFFILHLSHMERCLLAKKEDLLRKIFWRLFKPPQHSLYIKVFKSPFSLKELGGNSRTVSPGVKGHYEDLSVNKSNLFVCNTLLAMPFMENFRAYELTIKVLRNAHTWKVRLFQR